MNTEKEETKKWIKIILFALIGLLIVLNFNSTLGFIGKFMDIISPFVVGAALAFILNIPMIAFETKFLKFKTKGGKKLNKGLVRIVSLLLAIFVIGFIITLIVNLILPEIINIAKLLVDNFPKYATEIKKFAIDVTTNIPEVREAIENIDIAKLGSGEQVKNIATNVITTSISFASNLIGSIFNTVVSLVFAIYILTSKDKLKAQSKKILYAYFENEKAEKIIEFGRTSRRIFKNFITGQCLEATLLGILSIIGMLILRIPYAVPIGVLIGVTALIPIVGAFIGIIVGAILILSVEPLKVMTFLIFILILQQIEGNLIYPKVVGDSVGLPGIWVLVAVAVGGDLFGLIGMLLGLPIASILYTVVKDNVNLRLSKKS